MRYRKLDQNGDFTFGTGVGDFHINTPDAVAQAVNTRLNLWIGEWFADTSDGTGWNQAILGKRSKNLYELTLRQRILETPGVLQLESFESTLNTSDRRLTVLAVIDTIYGEAYLNESYESWP